MGFNRRLLAGGTDLLVHLKKRIITTDHIISLQRIESLARITAHPDFVEIGACATKDTAQHAKIQVLEVLAEQLKIPIENMDICNGFVEFKGAAVRTAPN